MIHRSLFYGAAVAALTLSLAGCGRSSASLAARDHSGDDAAPAARSTSAYAASSDAGGADRDRGAPVERASYGREAGETRSRPEKTTRLVEGHPLWAENRSHTAEENAEYQFEHHKSDLGARDLDDFVSKAHRFVNSPPEGALTLARANGDHLLYDPKSNLFGVVRSDGAPRTVFKPDDGMAYWKQQESTQGERNSGYGSRRGARASRDTGGSADQG